MGVFRDAAFAKGRSKLTRRGGSCDWLKRKLNVGGERGDSVAATMRPGLADKVCTSRLGGEQPSLNFLAGAKLPGGEALTNKVDQI